MANKKEVLVITPSILVAKGLEGVFADMGEFRISAILTDLSRGNEIRLKNMEPDIILLDPSVLGQEDRPLGKSLCEAYSDAPVLALATTLLGEESLRQYDSCISLFDAPNVIVKKLRAALESRQEAPKAEGDELTSREKEILICVAKGMLNKEIADCFNLSIYTVITHRKNITRKTGIKTVAGLTVYALLNNLIDINSVE